MHEGYTVFSDAKAAHWHFSSVSGCMFSIILVMHPNICKMQGNWKHDIVSFYTLTSETIMWLIVLLIVLMDCIEYASAAKFCAM